jgi:uncharacterized protein
VPPTAALHAWRGAAGLTEPQMHWPDLVDWSKEHNLLAKRLYVVTSVPASGLGPILENLEPHVAYQTRLEKDGVMFAAGPLADDAEQEWNGKVCSCTGPPLATMR